MLLRRNFSIVSTALMIALGTGTVSQAEVLYHGSMNGQGGFGVPIPVEGLFQYLSDPLFCRAPAPTGISFASGMACDMRGVGVQGPTASAPGAANVTGSGPAAFTIPAGNFKAATSYPRSPGTITSPFFQSSFRMTATNAAGSFFAGGGPGNTTFCPGGCLTPTQPGTIIVQQSSAVRFGGTMQLLGVLHNANAFDEEGGNKLWAILDAPVSIVGGALGNTAMAPIIETRVFATGTPTTTMLTVSNTAFGVPWTTGKVTIINSPGVLFSSVTESGTDLRTPMGEMGSIKMVSGWLNNSPNDWTNGEYELNLTFAPEPAATAMLASGILLLTSLARARARRR
jgi:hypothetical protein